MKKEVRNNKNFILLGIFILLLFSIILPIVSSLDFATGSQQNGFQLIANVFKKILTPSFECRVLKNEGGKTYFIPTRTTSEWNAFSAALTRLGITTNRVCTYCGDGIVQSPNDEGINEQCDGNNNLPSCDDCGSYSCSSSCTLSDSCHPCDIPDPNPGTGGEPPTGQLPPGGCVLGDCGFIPT